MWPEKCIQRKFPIGGFYELRLKIKTHHWRIEKKVPLGLGFRVRVNTFCIWGVIWLPCRYLGI